MHPIDVAIIGGGLTGLTTAYYLNKAGIDFRVFDKKSIVGGVISTGTDDDFIFENGPNTGVIANPEIVELFEELKDSCTLEIAKELSKKRFILKNGSWHALPQNFTEAVKTPLFSLKDKFRILSEPFRKKGNNPNETLAELVKRRLGQTYLDYAIDPFVLGIFAGDPGKLVPRYAFPKLYNLEQDYGSFIRGSIKKKKEVKTEREKKVSKNVFSVENGLWNLPKAMYKKMGADKFVLHADNLSIKLKPDGKYLITLSQRGCESKFLAKHVVTTTGAYTLREMLPFLPHSELQIIEKLEYASVNEVIIGFEKWTGMKLDGFGGLIPHSEKRNLLGVLFMSSLFKNRAPEGGALLTAFMGGVRNKKINQYPIGDIKAIIATEMKSLMGLSEFKPDLLKINNYKYAIPQYYADSSKRYETIERLQSQFQGLHLGGNIIGGIGIADRVKQGREIAEKLIELSKEFEHLFD